MCVLCERVSLDKWIFVDGNAHTHTHIHTHTHLPSPLEPLFKVFSQFFCLLIPTLTQVSIFTPQCSDLFLHLGEERWVVVIFGSYICMEDIVFALGVADEEELGAAVGVLYFLYVCMCVYL